MSRMVWEYRKRKDAFCQRYKECFIEKKIFELGTWKEENFFRWGVGKEHP